MNAITAKLGIDIEPLKQGLAKAEAMSVASSKRTAEAAKKLAKEAQESAKQLAEHGKGAASQLVNATSASELLGSGVEQVGAAFGALGAIAGVALGGAISKMGDAIDQAREMREAVAHAATPQGGPGFSTVGSINSHLSDAMATGGALNDNLQHHVVRSAFMEALAGKGGNTAKNLSAQLDAVEKGAQADIGNLAAKKAQIASIDEKRVNLGERSAALAKVELDLEEAKGDALRLQTEAKNKGLVLNASPLIAQAEKEAEFKREEINRQAAAQERGMTLEGQLTSIRAEGNNAAVGAAEARESGQCGPRRREGQQGNCGGYQSLVRRRGGGEGSEGGARGGGRIIAGATRHGIFCRLGGEPAHCRVGTAKELAGGAARHCHEGRREAPYQRPTRHAWRADSRQPICRGGSGPGTRLCHRRFPHGCRQGPGSERGNDCDRSPPDCRQRASSRAQ